MGALGDYMNGPAHGSIWDSWHTPLALLFGTAGIADGIIQHNGDALVGGILLVGFQVFLFVFDFGAWTYARRRDRRGSDPDEP